MMNTSSVEWNERIAKSTLHKALRRADVEMAAYAAAWLLHHCKKDKEAAWRRVLAFPAEDLCGEGAERVAALYTCWLGGHEHDNLFAAIIYLCRLVNPDKVQIPDRPRGQLLRWADELKNAAIAWVVGGHGSEPRQVKVPEYALDHHCGHEATTEKWWVEVNSLAPPSPWRTDAMLVRPSVRGHANSGKPAQEILDE